MNHFISYSVFCFDDETLAQKIDRTLLRPDVTMEEMACFLAEATSYLFHGNQVKRGRTSL